MFVWIQNFVKKMPSGFRNRSLIPGGPIGTASSHGQMCCKPSGRKLGPDQSLFVAISSVSLTNKFLWAPSMWHEYNYRQIGQIESNKVSRFGLRFAIFWKIHETREAENTFASGNSSVVTPTIFTCVSKFHNPGDNDLHAQTGHPLIPRTLTNPGFSPLTSSVNSGE